MISQPQQHTYFVHDSILPFPCLEDDFATVETIINPRILTLLMTSPPYILEFSNVVSGRVSSVVCLVLGGALLLSLLLHKYFP